jgi:hypothetical protein
MTDTEHDAAQMALFDGVQRDPDPELTRLERLAIRSGVTEADLEQEVIARAHRRAAYAYDAGELPEHTDDDAHEMLHAAADRDAAEINGLGMRGQLRYLRDRCGAAWVEQALPHMAPPRLRSVAAIQAAAARALVVFDDGTYAGIGGCRVLVLAPGVIDALVDADDEHYLRDVAQRYGIPILDLLRRPDSTFRETLQRHLGCVQADA